MYRMRKWLAFVAGFADKGGFADSGAWFDCGAALLEAALLEIDIGLSFSLSGVLPRFLATPREKRNLEIAASW